jgi:hypothetical protein
MAPKSTTYWNPDKQGHLYAMGTLNKNAPNLTKSGPVVQRKLASFRAAAKLSAKVPKVAPIKAVKPPPMPSMAQPPAGVKPLGIKPATPLKTSLPPKVPTTPA